MNKQDVLNIANAISGEHGHFCPSQLVSKNDVVLVKPSATTSEGVVLSGAEIAAVLPSGYFAYPVGVSYGADVTQAFELMSGTFGADLDAIDSAMAEAVAFGVSTRRAARIKARYKKAFAKFVKCSELLSAGKGKLGRRIFKDIASKDKRLANRAKACDKKMKRLNKIYAKARKLGVDVGMSPQAYLESKRPKPRVVKPRVRRPPPRARMAPRARPVPVRRKRRARKSRPVRPMQPAGETAAEKQARINAYLADQRAAEAALSQSMPTWSSFSGHDEELLVDIRAEAVGFLYGDEENDYFGLGNVDDAEILMMGFDGQSGRKRRVRRKRRLKRLKFKKEAMGKEEMSEESAERLKERLERLQGRLSEIGDGFFDNARRRVLEKRIALIQSRLEKSGQMDEDSLFDDDFMGADIEAALMDDIDIPMVEAEGIMESEGAKEIDITADEAAELSDEKSELFRILQQVGDQADSETLSKLISQIKAIQTALTGGGAVSGVDYDRLQVAQPGADTEVILIGIEKVPQSDELSQTQIDNYLGQFGIAPGEGGLLEVMGVSIADLHEAKQQMKLAKRMRKTAQQTARQAASELRRERRVARTSAISERRGTGAAWWKQRRGIIEADTEVFDIETQAEIDALLSDGDANVVDEVYRTQTAFTPMQAVLNMANVTEPEDFMGAAFPEGEDAPFVEPYRVRGEVY